MAADAGSSPLFLKTTSSWRSWLKRNHTQQGGSWVLMAKKGTSPGISYREAVEEALCWGWIDGKTRRHDERYFAQWFAPRRPKSVWSNANKQAVERLIAEDRIRRLCCRQVRECLRVDPAC